MQRFNYRPTWLMVIGLAVLAPSAHAGLVFSVNQDGCTGGCGTSPFATVTLNQVNADTVLVTEVLLNGDKFINTGAGDALEFNVFNDPAITISNITPGFSVGSSPDTASTFGSFDYSITCSGCGPGASKPLSGPLTFDVSLTGGGPLSIDSFTGNIKGDSFSSDIIGNNGDTGNVAAQSASSSTVPEPGSGILLAAGGAILFLLFLKKRSLA